LSEFVKTRVAGLMALETPLGPSPVVLLEDDKERILLIVIGRAEASSIAVALEGRESEVPLSHDVFLDAMKKFGITLREARIYGIEGQRFLAKLILESSAGTREIEARPSDSIALALRAEVPITVSEDVMEQASFSKSELLGEEGAEEAE